MTTNDSLNKLDHVADLIDSRLPVEAEQPTCPSDPEEQELLRLSGNIGRQLYETSDKVKQMEREDWALFAASHHLPEAEVTPAVQSETAGPDLRIQASDSHRHFWRGAITGAAASFVLCAIAAWMWWIYQPGPSGLMAYQANEESCEVVLQSASGSTIALSTPAVADTMALAQLGAKLHQADDAVDMQQPSECLDYTEPQTTQSKVEMQTLTVPNGKDFALQLADGTKVYLNAESRLEYPSRFEGAERVVSLRGEAYFEVAKDAQHPFVVQTQDVATRVLGTTFVVRNYGQNRPTIALIEGRVEVSSVKQPSTSMQLEAGQVVQLAQNGCLELLDEDIDQFTYWRSGYFYYDDKELVEIATEIGRWYNVNVVFENEELMHLRMHYFCNRQSGIEEAIRILNYQPDLSINLADKTVYIH